MYVITGASGQTGSAVATSLLAAGTPITVILRDEAKTAAWRERGATVVVADLADEAALTAVFRGAQGAYLMNPPAYTSADPLAEAARIANAYAAAARASALPHAVVLSSLGAASHEVGLIGTNSALETALASSGRPATFLRAGFFMQNAAAMLGPVVEHGVFPSFAHPLERGLPQIDVGDVGAAAADLLLAGAAHTDTRIVDLASPTDVSPADVAAAFGHALGKTVTAVAVARDEWLTTLMTAGFRREVADLFIGMYDALNAGRIAFTPGTPRRAGTTTIETAIARLAAPGS